MNPGMFSLGQLSPVRYPIPTGTAIPDGMYWSCGQAHLANGQPAPMDVMQSIQQIQGQWLPTQTNFSFNLSNLGCTFNMVVALGGVAVAA